MARKPDIAPLVPHRKSRLTASLAEFFLIFRLRARRTPSAASGVMERALRMVQVTSRNWFGRTHKEDDKPTTPDKKD